MMARPSCYCQFKDCLTTNLTSVLKMHRFPKEEERCRLWVFASENPRLLEKSALYLNKNSRLCSKHFAEWCFMDKAKTRLVHNAVPGLASRPSPMHNSPMVSTVSNDETLTPDVSITHNHSLTTSTPNVSDLQPTLTSTPSSKGALNLRKKYTPIKRKMAKLIKKKNDSLRKLKVRSKSLKKKLDSFNKPKMKHLREILQKCDVDKKLVNFIIKQVELNLCKHAQGRRFTLNEKLEAFSIYGKSRASYRALKSIIELPSETTLKRFISSKMSTLRIFALVFDEMSIKPKLIYNPILDNVCGFEDFGKIGRSQLVANQVLVLMIRSLRGNKKLPLCYYFSNGSVSSDYLQIIIEDLLEKLNKVHIIVKAIICDQGSSNCRLFSLLNIQSSKPYFIKDNQKIFGLFDPPHLLKTLRRNLMKYNLETSKGIVSFDDIKHFYEADQKRERQCAPKLTEKHIFAEGLNSMKVSLAAQVFSNTVSAGMSLMIAAGELSATSAETASFVGKINDIFDSLNGTSKLPLHGKPYHSAVSDTTPHVKLWNTLINDMASWKFKYKEDAPKNKKKLAEPRSKSGWLLTLNAVLYLYEDLKNLNFDYLMTRRLNQDCLENYFSRIRSLGGNNNNPTAYEFNSFFKIASLNSLIQVKKNKNCEEDHDKFFIELVKTPFKKGNHNEEDIAENLQHLTSDSLNNDDFYIENHLDKFDYIHQNVLAYLAGYVAKKVLADTTCENCTNALLDKNKKMDVTMMYLYFKDYNPDCNKYGLSYPSEAFLECFSTLCYICDEIFVDLLYKEQLSKTIKRLFCERENFEFLFDCTEHMALLADKIMTVSAKLFIKIHLRELNKHVDKKVFNLKKIRDEIKKRASSKKKGLEPKLMKLI